MIKQDFTKLINRAFYILFILLLSNCKRAEYDQLIKAEMNSGIVNDSLIFGMKLGQPKQSFFDQCWQMNKEGKIIQGPKNNFVQYDFPMQQGDDKTKAMRMFFYGIFNDDKVMTGLDLKFTYVAWAIWNKDLHADKLIPVVQDSLVKWFPGNDFIKIALENDQKEVYVKVDGTRRIIIEPVASTKELDVRIDDLRYALELKK